MFLIQTTIYYNIFLYICINNFYCKIYNYIFLDYSGVSGLLYLVFNLQPNQSVNVYYTEYYYPNINLINVLGFYHPALLYYSLVIYFFFYQSGYKKLSFNSYNKKHYACYSIYVSIILSIYWSSQEILWDGFWNWDLVEIMLLLYIIFYTIMQHTKYRFNYIYTFYIKFLIISVYTINKINFTNSPHLFSVSFLYNLEFFISEYIVLLLLLQLFFIKVYFAKSMLSVTLLSLTLFYTSLFLISYSSVNLIIYFLLLKWLLVIYTVILKNYFLLTCVALNFISFMAYINIVFYYKLIKCVKYIKCNSFFFKKKTQINHLIATNVIILSILFNFSNSSLFISSYKKYNDFNLNYILSFIKEFSLYNYTISSLDYITYYSLFFYGRFSIIFNNSFSWCFDLSQCSVIFLFLLNQICFF